jgi:hypothetical protein
LTYPAGDVFVADWQPTLQQLRAAKNALGVRSVVNLRHPSETGYVANESEITGCACVSVPLLLATDMTTKWLHDVDRAISESEKPVLVSHVNIC